MHLDNQDIGRPSSGGDRKEKIAIFIHEAVAMAQKRFGYITRESWLYTTSKPCMVPIKIQPTNSPDGCIIESESAKEPRFGWQPKAEDLVAEDWEVISLLP